MMCHQSSFLLMSIVQLGVEMHAVTRQIGSTDGGMRHAALSPETKLTLTLSLDDVVTSPNLDVSTNGVGDKQTHVSTHTRLGQIDKKKSIVRRPHGILHAAHGVLRTAHCVRHTAASSCIVVEFFHRHHQAKMSTLRACCAVSPTHGLHCVE